MKKFLLSTAIIFGLINFSYADIVNKALAKKVAETYLKLSLKQINPDLKLIFQSNRIAISGKKSGSSTEQPLYYVFNSGTNNGFIIIAGDDNSVPVLGYSRSGSFDKNNLPQNFRKWIEGYKTELNYIIENNIEATTEIKDEWKALKSGTSTRNNSISSVSPLLSTIWDQSPYYNDLCPGGSVTGCVATAMAQIMKYWEYPAQGSGFYSYNEDNYGTLSANFGGTTYQWTSMPNNVSSSNTAVATLMYHCGVSVDMSYSPEVSGAYVISSQSPVTNCSEYAYTTYFGYDNSVQGVERANYSASSWIQLIKTELDEGRPIEYAGFSSGGGHAFVCDGYDNNGYFHFNWGWGGAYDGYFIMDALNPTGTGTGGGTGGYNSGHQAVIGIKPPTNTNVLDMKLYAEVTPSLSTIAYGQAFDITTNIFNDGSNNFNGDYCAAVFDNSYNFIDFVEIKTDWSLEGGYIYSNGITFSTDGLLSMLPGTYNIGIFYRPAGENWVIVSDGNYSNLVEMTVNNTNDIEMNSSMVLTPGITLTQGNLASVNFNLLNNSSTIFFGTYSVDLFNLDGSWVEEIGTITESNGLPPGYTYTSPYLTISTSTLLAEPGTYLLAAMHQPDDEEWELTGSSNFQNPIYVTVKAPVVQQDVYESNNSESTAYNLSVNFTGNRAAVLTTGSNNHTGSDYDYYSINLPNGYNYRITPRAHDSFNSGNGLIYTNDVLWSYSMGGEWSYTYDDVMSSTIDVFNGGSVKFHVAPYFQGEKGTYLLDIQISRTNATGIDEIFSANNFKVFPNPVKEYINVLNERKAKIDNIIIYDITGKQIKNVNSAGNSTNVSIAVNELIQGTYILVIHSDNNTWQQKFIKK